MSLSGKSILIVSPDFPYPANHGGRVDIWGRLKILRELGFKIDLLVTVKVMPAPEDIDNVRKYVNELIFAERAVNPRMIFSILPYQVMSRSKLEYVSLKKRYDVVLLETDYVASILNNILLQAEHIVLRVHNDETAYFRALAKSVGLFPWKLYYWLESAKFYYFSPRLRKRVANLLFISHDEYVRFVSGVPSRHNSHNMCFLPPPLGEQEFKRNAVVSKKVLFLGSLFMPNNLHAITWYLKHVHFNLVDIPGYAFVIAGNMAGANETMINDIQQKYPKTLLRASPEHLDPIYRECAVFVNPMHHGTGVKLKTINAIEAGLAVVSTSVGKEGTGLRASEHLLVADTAKEFATSVRRLLMHPEEGQTLNASAQAFLIANYDHKKRLQKYFEELLLKKDGCE